MSTAPIPPQSDFAHEAPTFRWDTVFALPVERVNRAIVERKASPKRMEHTNEASQLELGADFGDWQVIPGGDGSIVRLRLPLADLKGSYVFKGREHEVSCAKLHVVVQIKLQFLAHEGPADELHAALGMALPAPEPGTTRHKLVARTETLDPADPVVEFVSFKADEPLSPSSAKILVEAAISEWCENNLDRFQHVFAVVDLNDEIATGQWAFCKPHYTSYAYVDKGTPESSVLAVLCMTSQDPVPDVQQVSNYAIPVGEEAGFLVSAKRYLADLALPALTAVWKKSTRSDFEVASNDKLLKLKDGHVIELDPVQDDDGNSYTPKMSLFTLEVVKDVITITSYTETEVSDGIFATCSSTHWYRIVMKEGKKGKTLDFVEAQPKHEVHGTYHSKGIDIAKTILEIAAIVLALLSIVLTEGASLAATVLLLCVVVGEFALDHAESAHHDTSPPIDLLVMNVTAPVRWTSEDAFELKSAGMNTSLQLGGAWKG